MVGGLRPSLVARATCSAFATYVQQTREELRKCTWPTWEELKGSTVVIVISIVLLGGFTFLVDSDSSSAGLFFRL